MSGSDASKSYDAWQKAGIVRADGQPFPQGAATAKLWVPVPGGPAFLLGPNFYAVRSYNPSMNYTLSIVHLGDRVVGGEPLVQKFPGSERAPTLAEVQEIQRRLTALGYDTGGTDGRIGNDTMSAVVHFQRKIGMMPADGYAGVTLRALNIPYIALNPGASYRGLHDSIVNYLGNETPQMLLCLHEESAVAIAQGYAKVTGKAMAAAVHSNVGLFHATMAIFNAWCDRTPVVILGATGPVDAAKRRPWIDWIHTAADQGAIVRDYTKWDDQPASPATAPESLLRAARIATTPP